MLRWAQGIQIPITDPCDENSYSYCAKIDNNIFIITDIYHYGSYQNTKLHVFDSDSQKVLEISSETFPGELLNVKCHENQLYMLRRHGSGVNEKNLLYKFSNEWKIVLTSQFRCNHSSLPMIGDNMYVLEKDLSTKIASLIVINLSTTDTKKFALKSIPSAAWIGHLVAKNDQLYLVEHSGNYRYVSVIEDKVIFLSLKELNTDAYQTDQQQLNWTVTWFDDMMFYHDELKEEKFLDTFDFGDFSWSRQEVEYGWDDTEILRMQSSVKICDQVYAVVKFDMADNTEFYVLELELDPKLTSICLINLIDNFEEEEVEELKESLPILIRRKIDGMLKWRECVKKLDTDS